jgi:hypothetical protein
MVTPLMDFGPYEIIFMNVCSYKRCHYKAIEGFWTLCDIINVCVVIAVAIVTLLRDFEPYRLFMTVFTTLDFPVNLLRPSGNYMNHLL